jgi:SAM-dependent methyltransferase
MTIHSEFDQFARNYESLHNANLSLVGADTKEFLQAKLKLCAILAKEFGSPRTEGKLFLDYGCGIGRLRQEFHNWFDSTWHYVGVDPSQASVQEAQNTFIEGAASTFHTLGEWQKESETYDVALAACVFHHIVPSARQGTLQELWGRMNPGGILIIWEHNPWNPVTRRLVNTCPFDADAVLLSLSEMKAIWESMRVNSMSGSRYVTFFPGPLRALKPLERFLGWLPIGGQWVFWAKKLS